MSLLRTELAAAKCDNALRSDLFQGFLVSDEELHMDLHKFREMYAHNGVVEYVSFSFLLEFQIVTNIRRRGRLNFYTSSRANPTDQIFIYFSEERNVGVKTMRK